MAMLVRFIALLGVPEQPRVVLVPLSFRLMFMTFPMFEPPDAMP